MTTGRPIEDLITELAEGIAAITVDATDQNGRRLCATSAAFDLPVETRLVTDGDKLVVVADVPRTRTRTGFDRPLSRLLFHVVRGGVE